MGFTFKKNKNQYGYSDYEIKYKREHIGYVSYDSVDKCYRIRFQIEDKNDKKGWRWITLKRKDKNVNTALEWLKKEDVFQKIMNNENYKIFQSNHNIR